MQFRKRYIALALASARILTLLVLGAALFCVSGAVSAQNIDRENAYQNSIRLASDPEVDEDVLRRHVVALNADDLADIADHWLRRVQTNLSIIAAGVTRIEAAPTEAEEQIVAELRQVNKSNIDDFERYLIVLSALARKGGSEEVLEMHHGYIRGFVNELILSYDWLTVANLTWDWLRSSNGGLRFFGAVFKSIIILIAAVFLARLARNTTRKWLAKYREDHEVAARVWPVVIHTGILLVGFVLATWQLGLNLGFTAAVIGGTGFLIAFILQNLFQSVVGGFLLQTTKPYAKGDIVTINQVMGTVVDVNVVATKLRTFDNRLVQIPNQAIWQGAMENHTQYRVRRVDLVFGIGYGDDVELATKTLSDMVNAEERCLPSPEPRIFVGELGPSSVNIFCRPWVRTDDYWDVLWDLTGLGKEQLQSKGIEIAFPQMDVHIHKDEKSASEDAQQA